MPGNVGWRGAPGRHDPAVQTSGEWFEYHTAGPGLATAMERLYRDRDILQQSSWECFTRATQPDWSWDSAARHWRELLLSDR